MRTLIVLVAIVLTLIPVAASAETIFMPQLQNGVRDWFTVQDVANWIAETQNVMPVHCYGPSVDIYTSCTVIQAKPLTLTWDNVQGKVVAHE